MAGHRNVPCLLFCLTTGIYRAIMTIYHNGKEYKVELQSILSQKLYNEVTPLLNELERSQGAQSAYETLLQKRILGDEYFKGKINLLEGANAWASIQNDFRLQEIVAEVVLTIRENIFEHISLNEQTIGIIFNMLKICINWKKVESQYPDAEFLSALKSESSSEFWQEQDLNSILEQLKFFRANVLARIKTSF